VKYDAIVIGAGHNGLVCAAYLARAGRRVLVLERREALGGMAGTSEILRGVRVPTLAHTVGRLRPSVARDLGLRDQGLRLVQPAVRVFAPQPDGRAVTLWGDAPRTAEALAVNDLVSVADAGAYAAIDGRARALGRGLAELLGRVPPDLTSPTLGDAFGGVRAGLAARSRARNADLNLMRVMPMAVRDLVGEWFASDALQAAVAARGVLLTALGPRMPGTTAVLLTDLAGNDGGLAGQTVFARGGPGALIAALAASARANGAEIRTRAPVLRVLRDGERVVGVVLASGEEIDASVVVSNLDPRSTLLDLVEPEALGPTLSWRASNIRQRGVTAKVNFALRDLPRFTAAGDDVRRLRGRILIAPSMRYLELAQRPAKYGETAAQPLIEATIPSLVDPELVRARRRGPKIAHVLSAVTQAVSGDGDVGEIVTRTLEEYAPGFTDLTVERRVIMPADIERDYGAIGGHPMHAEVALDQWFAWRPLHGYGRYRMPLDGLYLCGSGAHPGGSVTGDPGQLCAREVLSDWKRRRLQ
jgi:phytoene dehydrogenase-like protein